MIRNKSDRSNNKGIFDFNSEDTNEGMENELTQVRKKINFLKMMILKF